MPLEFRDVKYQQSDLRLEINLSFMDGLIVGLTGPNGAGKSLLLRLAAGLKNPDTGEVGGFTSRATAPHSFDSGDASEVRASIDSALEQHPSFLIVGESFTLTDPAYQAQTLAAFHRLRRGVDYTAGLAGPFAAGASLRRGRRPRSGPGDRAR